jgi:hypothetical protein
VTSGLVIRSRYPASNDVSLYWGHGRRDVGYYSVYRADTLNGVYTFRDSTADTSYADVGVIALSTLKFYRITSRYYGSRLVFSGSAIVPLEHEYARREDEHGSGK